MKLSLPLLFLGAVAVDSTSPETLPTYVPTRITFEDLANGSSNPNDDDLFWTTLREVGLLSITNIPDFNKQSMLKDLEDCLHHQTTVGAPDFNLYHLEGNSDGGRASNGDDEGRRRRRTLATRTLAGTPEGILVATTSGTKADADASNLCSDLQASSRSFREAVQRVSEAIATRFGSAESAALKGDNKIPMENLINEGEHLEHFHSYYSDQAATTKTGTTSGVPSATTTTIDWHTDQGMMLLFTPGQRNDGTIPNGFLIQLGDGTTAEVAFDSQIDDLVIMLGDGVYQYINNGDADDAPSTLRAVPHALTLPDNHHEQPRLWYGRMVLPPPEAIHPNGSTFQELRTAMIRGDPDALGLGCASSTMVVRELMDEGDVAASLSCDEDVSILCWMRCMNYTDHDVGVESCASESEDHSLVCANEGNELWQNGIHSAEYFPRCLSKEEVVGTSNMDMGMGGMDHSSMDHSSAASRFASSTVLGLSGMMIAMCGWTVLLA